MAAISFNDWRDFQYNYWGLDLDCRDGWKELCIFTGIAAGFKEGD